MFGLLMAAVTAALAVAEGTAEALPGAANDNVCGPRCAWYVLRHYGHAVDLIEVVRETQWPNLEKGTTLAQLQAALERRGVHTRAVDVPKDVSLCWNHPAIVHLRNARGNIGHFAVWIPSSNSRRVHVWDGLRGERTIPTAEFADERSGAILLTSPDSMRGTERIVVAPRCRPGVMLSLVGLEIGCGSLLAGVFAWRAYKRRKFPEAQESGAASAFFGELRSADVNERDQNDLGTSR
jgi:ABC-type bacteriocin/lantibiotic exporter with double-glycine peptidase domain